jgi:anti-sigma factor RsiW
MKSDALERLLIDHEAGELSPDVRELLEAHLLLEPAARKEAAEIGETLRLARLALSGRRVAELPMPRPSWHFPNWAWRMAACFVLGLSLGLFAMRGRNGPPRFTASIPTQTLAPMTTSDKSGIWSARRFRAALPPVTTKPENRIIWKAPFRKPEIL